MGLRTAYTTGGSTALLRIATGFVTWGSPAYAPCIGA